MTGRGGKKNKRKERQVIKVEQYLSEKTRSKTAGEEKVQGQRKKSMGCFIYLFLKFIFNVLLTLQLGLQSEKGPKDKVN